MIISTFPWGTSCFLASRLKMKSLIPAWFFLIFRVVCSLCPEDQKLFLLFTGFRNISRRLHMILCSTLWAPLNCRVFSHQANIFNFLFTSLPSVVLGFFPPSEILSFVCLEIQICQPSLLYFPPGFLVLFIFTVGFTLLLPFELLRPPVLISLFSLSIYLPNFKLRNHDLFACLR